MNYWEDRQAKTQTIITNRGIAATENQLKKYYKSSMEKTIKQFEDIYNKLLLQAKDGKNITAADLYSMDKYWNIQKQLQLELQELGDNQAALMSENFEKQYINVYKSIAIEGSDAFRTIDKPIATQVINQIWCADGKSWSSRVWLNISDLQETLSEQLLHCVVTGKKTSDLKRLLQERFMVSYNRADTIVRTEMAHIQTQAAQQRYKDYGIDKVQIWADKDERQCDVCGKLHKKVYSISDKLPIPVHPNCRCSIIPIVNSEESNREDIKNN